MTTKTSFMIICFSLLFLLSCSKEEEKTDDLSGTRWIANIDPKVHVLPDKYKDEKYYMVLTFLSNNEYSVDLQDTSKVTRGNMSNGKYRIEENVIYLGNQQAYFRPNNEIYYPNFGVNFVKQP